MMKKDLYFLDKWDEFPWDWLLSGVPWVGQTHSYLCTIMAPYADYKEKLFLLGNPTFFELRRYKDQNEQSIATGIYNYCEPLYNKSKLQRTHVAQEVLEFIKRDNNFTKAFKAMAKKKQEAGYD
jgi:hypothetical protein